MLIIAVRLFVRPLIGRTVPLAAVLLLLLAFDAESSAVPLSSPQGLLHPASYPAAPSGSYGADAGSGQPLPRSRESLIFASASSSRTVADPAPAADTAAGEPPSYQPAGEKRIKDWSGVRRDAAILFGSQIVATGFIYVMPESVSSWSGDQKKNTFKKYGQNFISPVIDDDKFYINYILHPYWGATYYTRARERGLNRGESFVYSTVISTLFEFGVECFYEKPSIQDLIVTPVAGSLIGAFIFEPWRDSVKRKGELRWYDHAVLIATDPIGLLSRGVEKMFGIKPTIMIDYSVPNLQKNPAGSPAASNDTRIGMVWQFPLD